MLFVVNGILRALLKVLIGVYRSVVRPHLCGCCRFDPHCSAYALQALEIHSLWRAVALIGRRILQCHSQSKRPLFDPVPLSGDPS